MTQVFGPYKDRDKWRLIVLAGGKRKSVIAGSLEEADRLKSQLSQAIIESPDRTVGELLPEYEEYLTSERGSVTAETRRRQLGRFLGESNPMMSFTPKRAAEHYAAEVSRVTVRGQPTAAAAHRTYLAEAKRFFKWAMARGYVAVNVFAEVRPVGRPKVGKTQLRIDEARRFVEVAMKSAQTGDKLALAALLALMLGARASEILLRQSRDVDDHGAILWIPHGKTKNAKRRLTIPLAVRSMVQKLVEGKPAESYLFATRRDEGKPYSDTRLWQRIGELCEEAKVPRVCTHSLRGLHATLSVSAGTTSEQVAASLGHASFAITEKHYADPGAVADKKTRDVTHTLFGDSSGMPGLAELLQKVASLGPAERAQLRAALDLLTS